MANLRVNKIAAVGVSTENTGSVFFDGPTNGASTATDALVVPSSSDFAFGTGDFTMECWVWGNDWTGPDTNKDQVFMANDGASGASNYIGFYIPAGVFAYYTGSAYIPSSNKPTLSDQQWYHVAVSRESGTSRVFLDGVLVDSGSDTNDIAAGQIILGRNPSNNLNQFNGYLSNVRMCKGHAVYKSNFTPPTRELEVHPETVLLCCHDGENIFADKSGRHIIAAYGDRLSSPTPTATDSPIGITTFQPGLTRSVDATAGPTFQGGAGFVSQNWLTLPKGTTTDRNLCGTRGLFAGSNPQPGDTGGNTIEFITVSTTGNTQDFGDRIGKGRRAIAAMSGSTRAVFAGSYGPSSTIADTIDYVNIATTGNAVDFGNCLSDLTEATGISNSTRGIIAGGRTPTVSNVMQYVTIPTLGNAIDFGDLSVAKRNAGSFQSSTRGVVAGGRNPSGTELNVIEYVTIASTGNAVDFGDISSGGGQNNMGGSNSTRGLVAGGNPSTNTITYVTISTLGNSVDFGDNTAATHGMNTMATSPTRACMFGAANPARTLSYVEIATTGNALDFGSFGIDATTAYSSGCSNSHGGLS